MANAASSHPDVRKWIERETGGDTCTVCRSSVVGPAVAGITDGGNLILTGACHAHRIKHTLYQEPKSRKREKQK